MGLVLIRAYLRVFWETLSFRRSYRSSPFKKNLFYPFINPQHQFLRKFASGPLKNQRGQTIIEYILLIVVILTIAYALGKNFFAPLNKFGSSVFTSTIACALEYGQLPAEITSEEGCDASLQVSMGNSGSGSSRGGRSKSGSSNSSKNGNSDSKSADKSGSESAKNEQEKGSSSSKSGNSGETGGGGSSTTVKSGGETLSLGKSSGAEAQKSNNTIVYDSAQMGVVDNSGDGSGGLRRRKPIYKAIRGYAIEEVELRKKKEKIIEGAGGRSIAGGGVEDGKPKKLLVNHKKEAKSAESNEPAWDASKILRMALIILMILAILIFVFFQVSQIRKGSQST